MKKMNKIISAVMIFALSACISKMDEAEIKPDFEIPKEFSASQISEFDKEIINNWSIQFDDPILLALIEEGIKNNPDLEITALNIEKAIAEKKVAGAELFPTVNAFLASESQGNIENSDTTSHEFSAGASVSWEIDVWGRIRTLKQASLNQLKATKYDFLYAKESLASAIARLYFNAVDKKLQYEYTTDNLESYKKTVDITKILFENGDVSKQELYLAEAELAQANNSNLTAENEYHQALRDLEILLGRYPSAAIKVGEKLPSIPEPIGAGIPSDILERRPDIKAAGRRVASAFNLKQEARLARLPKLSLTSGSTGFNIGGASSALSEIADPENVFWNVLVNLVAPIFQGGRLIAKVELETANQKQALQLYKKAALNSFAEAERAISLEKSLRERLKTLNARYSQVLKAEEIEQAKYNVGEGRILDLQAIKRNTIAARRELIAVQSFLLQQRVNLYLALGGNF